ncbi:MAG: glutathione S-transferase N-terminal domain-containing protein [Betaproteobacteria bacterium]|nr:glutathione S-transferase N-terminal domain-containing protein [Betaproteobacteria bacterium]
MKLYATPTSPYARKARVLIHEKKLKVELVQADPWPEDSVVPGKNPLGKVPVLELAPDSFLFESQLVVHYLDRVEGKSLEAKGAVDYWQSQWWQALGNGIIDAVIQRVIEGRRPEDKRWDGKLEREAARIARAVAVAEGAYKGGKFLVADNFTLADLVLGVALRYVDFRYPHNWRAGAPNIARWHEGIVARPSFVETEPPGFIAPA